MKEKIFKYLKTICLWILIVSFITSCVSFANNISSYIKPVQIDKSPIDASLVSQAEDIEYELNKLTKELKELYGENYPALGIVYYKAILHYSSESLVQNFLFSLIAGFGLGNIVYFVFIAKYKKYKLFLALIIALFITALFFTLTDILTNFVNNEDFKITISEILFTMEVTAIPYTIVSLILIVVQKVSATYIEIRNS